MLKRIKQVFAVVLATLMFSSPALAKRCYYVVFNNETSYEMISVYRAYGCLLWEYDYQNVCQSGIVGQGQKSTHWYNWGVTDPRVALVARAGGFRLTYVYVANEAFVPAIETNKVTTGPSGCGGIYEITYTDEMLCEHSNGKYGCSE
mgnify:CR=1 FL=1